jgi:hypothetical protein
MGQFHGDCSGKLPALMRLICAFCAVMTIAALAHGQTPQQNTATEAVEEVFAKHSARKQVSPVSGDLSYSSLRPLSDSTFAALRRYFSVGQQQNADRFLGALRELVDARNRLAGRLAIKQEWWWPITGIELLKVRAVVDQDLVTGRSYAPDKMVISEPKIIEGKLEIKIQETFTEVGQDRVLGQGNRTSVVTFIPQKDRWVIDEIKTTTTDAYGETSAETLTQRLQNAVKPLHAAERAISKLPQTPEVRKGVKANN